MLASLSATDSKTSPSHLLKVATLSSSQSLVITCNRLNYCGVISHAHIRVCDFDIMCMKHLIYILYMALYNTLIMELLWYICHDSFKI